MARVLQSDSNPTRKLTAAMIAAAGLEIVKVLIRVNFPEYDQPELWSALSPLVIGIAGWFTTDDANVRVTVEEG